MPALKDALSLQQRQVELMKVIEEGRDAEQEYRENQETLNKMMTGNVTTFRQTAAVPVSNGYHAKPGPKPKATGSKTDFVKACFKHDPAMSPKEIITLWEKQSGNGSLSPALVYKTKHDMKVDAIKVAKKIAAAPRKTTKAPAAVDPSTEVQEVVWSLLQKKPMTTGELREAIQDGEYIDPVPRKLDSLIRNTIRGLRDSNKVSRSDKLQYSIVQGASL
jgi:hypothetical protein